MRYENIKRASAKEVVDRLVFSDKKKNKKWHHRDPGALPLIGPAIINSAIAHRLLKDEKNKVLRGMGKFVKYVSIPAASITAARLYYKNRNDKS